MTENLLMGKYELKEKIGTGSSSIVYLAWDRHLERYVAVKEEKDVGEMKGTEEADDAEKVENTGEIDDAEEAKGMKEVDDIKKAKDAGMLKREMEMLKALKHPMLPEVYDYFQESGQYLVMEYIRGEGLHNFIEREGAIPEKQACKWVLQLLELFSYLHGQKPPVIYRDLKPDNIIICPDGNLRVVDFGTALYSRYDNRTAQNLAGTAGYAAPEQLQGHMVQKGSAGGNAGTEYLGGSADERSDIYTLGATLYHMLTGHHPARPPYGIRPVRYMNPEVTRDMEWIVAKCTAEEPDRRYQTVEELRTDLEKRKFSGRRRPWRNTKSRHMPWKLEKRIWLTEKKTTGLFVIGLLLYGLCAGFFSMKASGRETPLPVIVYNKQGQKMVIRYDSVYRPDGNLLFELEQELFGKEGAFELSIGLTDCATGERRERVFYIQGGGTSDAGAGTR